MHDESRPTHRVSPEMSGVAQRHQQTVTWRSCCGRWSRAVPGVSLPALAKQGKLDKLQWPSSKGAPGMSRPCSVAVDYGHLEWLQRAHAHSWPPGHEGEHPGTTTHAWCAGMNFITHSLLTDPQHEHAPGSCGRPMISSNKECQQTPAICRLFGVIVCPKCRNTIAARQDMHLTCR